MNIVRAYIQYLRDVSRKIISRSGFENVLPRKRRNKEDYYYPVSDYSICNSILTLEEYNVPSSNEAFTKYLSRVRNYLDAKSDYRLFIGIGLIHGMRNNNQQITAPLLSAIVEVEVGEENRNLSVSIDKQSLQINYDLLARCMSVEIDEEEGDSFIPAQEVEKFRAIEEVEKEIESIAVWDQSTPISIFTKLKSIIEGLSAIEDKSQSMFDYDVRHIPLFNSTVGFFKDYFLFVHKIPDELSTYEALNALLEQQPLNNDLLNKLFESVLLNSHIDFRTPSNITEGEIESALLKVPMSLSNNQIEAVKKIWVNGVSYIEGPPGTGKSHTICAIMILSAILNQRVLLVSQKKVAINIVREKIDELLGGNAVINVGEEDKAGTRTHLSSLSDEGRERVRIRSLDREVEQKWDDFDQVSTQIKFLESQIEKDLQIENSYYKYHVDFIKRRNEFSSLYEFDLKTFLFREYKINYEKYKTAIRKLNTLQESKKRVDLIYEIKLIKHFIELFGELGLELPALSRWAANC